MSCTVNHNLDILEESIGFCPKGICHIPRIGLYLTATESRAVGSSRAVEVLIIPVMA